MTANQKHQCHTPALAMSHIAGTTHANKARNHPARPDLASGRSRQSTGFAQQADIAFSEKQDARSPLAISTHSDCCSLRSPSLKPSVVLQGSSQYAFCMESITHSQRHQQNRPALETMLPNQFEKPVCDNSGYAVFSEGEIGAMHVLAHRFLDSGEPERGYHMLGTWLAGRSGQGTQWVHIQWHMAVFELSLGHWQAALNRFWRYILPAVLTSHDALTDAPALLWRLAFETTNKICLPWDCVRDRAMLSLQGPCSPFVKLHNLLALAGAGDIENLDAWIRDQTTDDSSRDETLVIRFASTLRAFAAGDFATAASALATLAPKVTRIGGSRAQNEIFFKMRDVARQRAANDARSTPLLHAA